MKVLVTTSSFDLPGNPALQGLAAAGCQIVLNPYGRRLSEDEVAGLLDADVVGMVAGVEPLTRRVLAGASGLKFVSRAGIGMDSVDLAAAAELGIGVANTPNAPVPAVAELTIGLMLDLLRHIGAADRGIRAGQWKQTMGRLLGAQTVGLVGCGRIGLAVAQLAQAFGATVLAHDPAYAGSAPRAVALDELLSAADIVSLHMPYGPATHHIADAAFMARMKRGALLVNASRGGLVDEAALASALASGHLAGAGLDTFEQEPYNGPLAALPQVVLTAHMGSYAKECRSRMEREAAENLVAGLRRLGVVVA